MNVDRISELREIIDSIDAQLVPLLEKRLQCSVAIGKEKNADHVAMYDEKREQAILDKVSNLVVDHRLEMEINQIFRELLVISKQTQLKLMNE